MKLRWARDWNKSPYSEIERGAPIVRLRWESPIVRLRGVRKRLWGFLVLDMPVQWWCQKRARGLRYSPRLSGFYLKKLCTGKDPGGDVLWGHREDRRRQKKQKLTTERTERPYKKDNEKLAKVWWKKWVYHQNINSTNTKWKFITKYQQLTPSINIKWSISISIFSAFTF